MKNRIFVVWILTFTVILLAISSVSFAQDIKARFKERLPKIIELKSQGIIGENNQGYLEFVGSTRQMQDLVDAENRDRRSVYEGIAKQQGTTVQTVGQRRALQLRDLANPGDWVQDDAGRWYRK
jgi:uncharacterized protein YdbL (DUF1318 family)